MNVSVVNQVRFTPASTPNVLAGLLGYVSFTLPGDLRLDGVTLRRTQSGEPRLSFPMRSEGARGRRRYLLRPLTDDARREIERQVFAALGMDQENLG